MKNSLNTKCGKMLLAPMWTFAVRYLKKTKTVVTKRCYNQLKTEPNLLVAFPTHRQSTNHIFGYLRISLSFKL